MKIRPKRVRVGLPNRLADRADLQGRRPPAPAESVTPQDVVGAVAHLLAAAVEVGGLPSCDVAAEVSRLGGQVLVVARKDGAELARASAAIA